MEESIQKLVSFLNEISWAETEADEFRGKLSSSRSTSRRIFEEIDQQAKGKITSHDICQFCQSQGSIIGETAVEIVGRYFQNWNKGISESEFWMALKPKSLLHQLSSIKEKEELTTFVSLINAVVTSFKNLETLRIEFSENWEDIVSYFMTDYDCDEALTKESLREFMLEHKIYSRAKFTLISGYIFGDNQESISWESFFKINKRDNKIAVIETSSRMLTEKSMEKLKRKQSQPEQERNSKNNLLEKSKKSQSKEESEDIHNVLSQIEEIEKNMKQRKLKTQTSVEQMLPPERLNSKTPTQQTIEIKDENDDQRKSCFGRSGSKIKKTVRLEEFDLNMAQTQWRKECFDLGKHTKRSMDFENFLHKPLFCPRSPENDYSIGVHKRSLSRGELMRNSSEAQLKINEIERRAMDKFLSSRRANHLPNDDHIPYFYQTMRPNFEMTRRMRGTEFNMDGISSFASPTSRISKLLSTKIDRAVSPKYFRS